MNNQGERTSGDPPIRDAGCLVAAAIKLIQGVVRAIAAGSFSRQMLNAGYLKLAPRQKALFHRAFAKIFRDRATDASAGYWRINFCGKCIRMPLTSENFWLEWDSAISIVGNDIEVKQTYESLLASPSEKPDLFIDIGSNYGTHSLLFLVHGVEVLSFEPNASCHRAFKRACELNGVSPNLEPVALGERAGSIELSYPARDTWLGSTLPEVVNRLRRSQDLVTEIVEMKLLDHYLSRIRQKRVLIKIDTEGNELSVLRGAAQSLRECTPMVIFECWNVSERTAVYEFFCSCKYKIFCLPWNPAGLAKALTTDCFLASSATNFLAMPHDRG